MKYQEQLNNKIYPTYLVSEYGNLINLKPYSRSRKYKTGKPDLREVRLIGDNTDVKQLIKLLNTNPTTYFLFHP